jgi:hypothetical protein
LSIGVVPLPGEKSVIVSVLLCVESPETYLKTSFPDPPVKVSPPAPPVTVSFPDPPFSVSEPLAVPSITNAPVVTAPASTVKVPGLFVLIAVPSTVSAPLLLKVELNDAVIFGPLPVVSAVVNFKVSKFFSPMLPVPSPNVYVLFVFFAVSIASVSVPEPPVMLSPLVAVEFVQREWVRAHD